MANWAKIQRQLANKPVAKRTKNSIHFDNGNGTFTANFSTTPCHYEEDGVWKELDTAIVELEDGSLGAKGVPVRLNLNGLVRLINENNEDLYSQVTTRVGVYNTKTKDIVDYINLPTGTVQNDKLVKETDNYKHTLTLTETGLREEIVVKSKPNFVKDKTNLWLVLDTVVTGIDFADGWLDEFELSQMHYPPPTATDAEGNELECKRLARKIGGVQHVLTGIKFSTLYGASYPVTIDPDFAVSTADGIIFGENDTYATARSTYTARYTSVGSNAAVGQMSRVTSPYFIVYRSFLAFDTSSIGAGSTITQVNLKVRTLTYEAPANDFDVQIVKFNLSGKTSEEQYDGILAAPADDSILCNTADGVGDKTSGNLSTVWVNKTGTTFYCLRSSRDYSNTEPSGYERIGIYFAEHENEAYRPVLTVTYSAYPVSYAYLCRPNIHLTRKVSTTTYPIMFLMVDSTDHVTGKTGLTPKAVISKNGVIFGGAAGVISEIGGGLYSLAGNATDRDTLGELWIHIEGGAGVDKCDIKVDIVSHDPYELATPTNITAGTITTATNLTNLPTMPTDWLTAAGVKADAVTKIQSGLATATALATAQADLDNPDQYKADVSAITGAALSEAGVDAILDEVVVGTYTLRQLLTVMAAAMAGKATGGGTTTVTFRGVDDTSDVIVATVDANGNRSAVTLTV